MADETLQQQPPTFSDELYKYAHDSGFIPKEATFDIFKKNLSNKDFVKELYDYSVQTEFIPKEATIDIFIKNIGGTTPAEKKNEKPATVSPVGGGSSGLLSVKFGGEDYEVNPTTQQVFKGGKPVTVPAHIKDYIEKNIIGSKPKDKPAEKPYVAKGAVILPEDYFDKKAMPKETAWLISDLTGMDMTALQNSPQVVDEAFKDLSTYTGIAVDKTSNPETITKAIGQAKMLRDTKEFTKLAKDAGVTEKKALEIAYDNAADKFLDSGDKELWALTKQVNQAFEGGDKATVDKLMPVWEKARKQFIDNRHDKITSLHNMIITGKNVDGVPLTSAAIEDLKKEKNLLTKQLNGFFKSPEAVVKDVVGSTPMLSVFDKQLEGKTGQQKLETIAKPMLARYFLLGKKMGVKTEDIMGEGNARKMQTDKTYLDDVKNYMGWGDYDGEVTSSDRKEFNDLHNKLGIIMPMLLINKIPVQDVEDKPVDILKKGALSMTPALATMNQTGQQKTNTLNDILALANITPDDLTQDALTSINTNMKKYGWAQDLAQMGGSTLSIIAPMMLAEAGAGFAIESLALNPRTAMAANFLLKNPVGKVIKGGTTFSAAGKISDGEELDFGTGAASGVVDVVLDALGSKNKAMAKWFISTFGKRATKIAAIAAKPLAKGTGEFFQESGETVYQAWRDTPEGKSVMETLQKQFPDADSRLKFFVGTTIMGGGMGLAGDIGFGGAKKRAYDALSPENKAKADAFMATRNQKAKDAVDEVVPVASNDAIENNLKVAKEAKEKLEKLANRDVEAEDKVIADFQQRTGYEPTLVEDVPKSIDTTLSRIDNGLPVDQTAKDELADWAYEQYKKLSLLKKSDARKATTAQIQQAQDYLEGIITNINDEITAKKIEAEKDTEGITPYSVEVDGVTYSGSTLQDLQRDIDFLDHVENTANDELYKRNTGQTETPPIAEADQTDVELAKPEAGVGVEGEVVPETVQNAQESGQNVEDKKAETKEAYVTRRKDEIFKQLKNKYPTLITGDAINPMIVQPKYMSIEDVELAQKVLDPRILELEYDAELAALNAPTTTTSTTTEILPQEGEVKETVEDTQVSEPTKDVESFELVENEGKWKPTFSTYKGRAIANWVYNFLDKKQIKEYDKIRNRADNYGTKEAAQENLKLLQDFENNNKEAFEKAKKAIDDLKQAEEIADKDRAEKQKIYDKTANQLSKLSDAEFERLIGLIDKNAKDTLEKRFGGRVDRKVLFKNRISEDYHKAKADGSNPDLVKAVEELLAPKGATAAQKQGKVTEQDKNTVRSFTIGYAPFREGNVSDLNETEKAFKNKQYQAWLKLAGKIASEIGIRLNTQEQTVGIYGETSEVAEASSLVTIEGTTEQVELFAAIMGSIAPDVQNSVMVLDYADSGNAIELRIKFNNKQDAINFVNNRTKYGVNDLSLHPETNEVLVLDFGDFNHDKLIKDYGQSITTKSRRASVRFVEEQSYSGIIRQERDRVRGRNTGGNRENFGAILEHAQNRADRRSGNVLAKSEQEKVKRRKAVSEYLNAFASKFGIPNPKKLVKNPTPKKGSEIARQFDKLKTDNSKDPNVKASYEQLAKEIEAQYEYLTKVLGIKVIFTEADPYANSEEMMADVYDNKRLVIFKGGEPHPFMDTKDKNGVSITEKFRAVHDYFGHAIEGNQFGAVGEERAWLAHSQMFSPLARKAMTTETRGQNSWVNNSDINKKALEKFKEGNKLLSEGNVLEGQKLINEAKAEFVYAEQKIDLLPDEYVSVDEYTEPSSTPTEKVETEPTADIDNVADKAGIAPKKAKKAAIQSDVIDKLVGKATERKAAVENIADENIKEFAKAVTDTKVIDKVMDAIDNNDQLLADLEKKLGIKKICRI